MTRSIQARRYAMAFILVMVACVTHSAFAKCTTTNAEGNGDGVAVFPLPATIVVAPDTPVGSVIFEQTGESGEVTIDCSMMSGMITKSEGYITLTSADARDDVLEGVYQTNVPGIGIRAASSTTSVPKYYIDDIITPWHSAGYVQSHYKSTHNYRVSAQIVVTGVVKEGYLDTTRLTSQEKVGGALQGELRFSPASVHIVTVAHTCNLVDKNIFVPLKTINASHFEGSYSDILTDDNFKIALTDCSEGTQVDYQFTSSGSTGVTNGTILSIAEGDHAASGVGIQILDKDNNVLTFDRNYTALSSTRANEAVDIPLKARYVKTGDVKGGKVDSVATFEVFYR